jgi:hypothetical protein
MSFQGMRTWYDRLSDDERSGIAELRGSVGNPTRILPLDHGDSLKDNLKAAERAFALKFVGGDPFFFVRITDTALGLLSGGSPLLPETHKLEWKLPMSGLARDAFHLRAEFIEAVQSAHLLGVYQNWDCVACETAVTLSMLGISIPCERAVEAWGIRNFLVKGGLFSALLGKKVVLVGHLAGSLKRAFSDSHFIDSHAGFGPLKYLDIVGAIETSPRADCRWEEIGSATEKLKGMEFDVALLAFGGPSKILAHRVWKMGKTALDVGGVFDALLSVDPYQRGQKPVYKDFPWPDSPGTA